MQVKTPNRPIERHLIKNAADWAEGDLYNRGRLRMLKKIMKFGKPYINSFPEREFAGFKIGIVRGGSESPFGMGIYYPSGMFAAKLIFGFGKKTFKIYALSGKQSKADMKKISEKLGKFWAELLMEKALGHAQELKFKNAELLNPRHNPEIDWHQLNKERRSALIAFYEMLKKKYKFVGSETDKYWVKELSAD